MFVYYYVEIEEPFGLVERRLLERLGIVEDMATEAYREGEKLRTKIGIGADGQLLAKSVKVDVGPPLRGERETEIPISWRATGTPGLFPSMDAGIVIAALGPDLTHIALRGSYEPPLGSLGRALDRTLLHRIAEASVKSFLDRLAASLSSYVIVPSSSTA
ncbi:MAG TPA: hypothetical protein VJ818_03255 [Actinomycetota bacterium]|nr:hypothetical protein [Actinomycetota bacterium]